MRSVSCMAGLRPRPLWTALLLATVLMVWAPVFVAAGSPAAVRITDFRGVPLCVEKPSRRIVCLIESALSGLFMLGVQDRVVGISTNIYQQGVYDYYAAMDPRIADRQLPAPGNWDFVNPFPDHGRDTEALAGGGLEIAGRSMAELTLRERARILGFLPQHHRPVFPFRVDDVVLTGRAGRIVLAPGRQDRAAAREAMDRVGIGHLRRCLFTELSGGEQQLVMIARVLAQNPAIVLLDEPTSHLDFYYQAKVMGVIRELVSEGLTAVAVLYDPNQAMMFGQRLLFLRQGRLLERGGAEYPDDVQLLEQVYGMALEMVGNHRRRLVVPRP